MEADLPGVLRGCRCCGHLSFEVKHGAQCDVDLHEFVGLFHVAESDLADAHAAGEFDLGELRGLAKGALRGRAAPRRAGQAGYAASISD